MNSLFPECKHSWNDELHEKIENTKIDAQDGNKDSKIKNLGNFSKITENCFKKNLDDFKGQILQNSLKSPARSLSPFDSKKETPDIDDSLKVAENEQSNVFKDFSKLGQNEAKTFRDPDLNASHQAEINRKKNLKKFSISFKEKLSTEPKPLPSFITSETAGEVRSSSFSTLDRKVEVKKPNQRKLPPESDSEVIKKFKIPELKNQSLGPFMTPLQKNRISLMKTPNIQVCEQKFVPDKESLIETKKMLKKIEDESEKETFLLALADLVKIQEMIEAYVESALEREEFARRLLGMQIEEIPELDPVILKF